MKNNKTRILQLNLNGEGGAFSIIYQLQKCLSKEYIFDYYWPGKIVSNSKIEEIKSLGSRFYEFPSNNKLLNYILLPIKLYKFLKNSDYEIVHINADTAYKVLLYAYPARKAGIKKIIVHSHSSEVNGNYKLIKKVAHKVCQPFLKQNANVYLTCSMPASRWMYGDCNKVSMINNGVDLKKYKYNPMTRAELREKLNLKNKIVLGIVGNLSYQKYPQFMIKVLKQLPSCYMLLFVGDGPNKKQVEKYAKEIGVRQKCIFYGNTDHVERILNVMDIYVMPSRFEGLPVSAVEAQANGLPTILSDRITKEVQILPTCKMLSIDDNKISKWVVEIQNSKSNSFRRKANKILKNKGFDISDSAKKLGKLYSN